MAIFKYTVANKQNKKLAGSIEAPDETSARAELNNLGFSILELALSDEVSHNETQQEKTSEGHIKFVFEAINPQGQKITGTISALEEIAAYKRLTEEYDLTVTAIWKEGSTEDQIKSAKSHGTFSLQEMLDNEESKKLSVEATISQEQQKQELIVRTKVENILKQVNEILLEYEQDITPEQKHEIDKQIDKLLRIKNSTNTEYIITTAEELLNFIQAQEAELKKKNYLEKRTRLKLRVKNMLDKLHESGKPKTLSEDIVQNIQKWQQKYVQKTVKIPWYTKLINTTLLKIKKIFETPEEIRLLKSQIKNYNTQLIEYIKIYFKEPTKDYKAKAKEAIKTIWTMRKKAIKMLAETKKRIKQEKSLAAGKQSSKELKKEFFQRIQEDISEFTGWLLAFYLIYYFVSLYMTSKDFGLGLPEAFPKSLNFYDTQIFKYILAIIFLLHTGFTIKTNFFEKTKLASLIIFPITLFMIIFVLVNF